MALHPGGSSAITKPTILERFCEEELALYKGQLKRILVSGGEYSPEFNSVVNHTQEKIVDFLQKHLSPFRNLENQVDDLCKEILRQFPYSPVQNEAEYLESSIVVKAVNNILEQLREVGKEKIQKLCKKLQPR